MSIAELRKLPPDEKLRIIQALWDDLAADADAFESPAWHEDELRKTEKDFAAGRIEVIDWAEAKEELDCARCREATKTVEIEGCVIQAAQWRHGPTSKIK